MKRISAFWVLLILFNLNACSGAKHMEVELPRVAPEKKMTNYSDALYRLGEMTEYLSNFHGKLYIQSKPVVDKTGDISGDIPVDVTEMLQSAINRIGGKIGYVPYNPIYMQETQNYFQQGNLIPPDVVISGAITEYDRSTEVTGDSADFGGEFGAGGGVGVDAGFSDKRAVSSISIDMNMIDFTTMTMLPRIQSVNTIKVYKGAKESDIGFSLFGQSFGLKGTVKKIQGRHAAVRTLVEMCVLELIGKQQNLPYWRCVEGANEDRMVIRNRKKYFRAQKSKKVKVALIQQTFPLYGIEGVRVTGTYGPRTKTAMKAIASSYSNISPALTADFYVDAFKNVTLMEEPRFDVAALNKEIAMLPEEQEVKKTERATATNSTPSPRSEVAETVQSTDPVDEGGFNLEYYKSHMEAAKREFRLRNFENAMIYLQEGAKNGVPTGDAEPFLYLAYAAQELNDMKGAEIYLQKGIESAPLNMQLYKAYIRFLVSQNEFDQAKEVIEEGLKVSPDNTELEYLKLYLKTASK